MKRRFIIANWKSNKTRKEVIDWVELVGKNLHNDASREIIICPSTIHLQCLKEEAVRKNIPIRIGAQDVSEFPEGTHTGEINGKQVKELADYVIIGHSERRKMGEDSNTINHKTEEALRYGITPIICVSEIEQIGDYPFRIESSKILIAYEPLFAIGSGNPDTPENANRVVQLIKKEAGDVSVLYGGSVTSINVRSFTSQEHIDGVLVGGASLDAKQFLLLIKNA